MQEKNVNQLERLVSVFSGGALIGYGVMRRSLPQSALSIAAGIPLVQRGWTGHCAVYDSLNISTAETSEPPAFTGVQGSSIRIEQEVTINRPVSQVFRYWSNFENFPRFMDHLKEVKVHQNGTSHWVAKAPLGTTVEWDATVSEFRTNELIAWKSRPGTLVPNEGSVRFKPAGEGATTMHVAMHYHPPAGVVGATIARLLGEEPSKQLEDDLQTFKDIMETPEVPIGRNAIPKNPPGSAPRSDLHGDDAIAAEERENIAEAREHKEDLSDTDQAVDQTFPASDPPSFQADQAGS